MYYICNMKDLPGRLITFIKYLGLNNSRFADEINVQRSGISHILSGRNKPGMDFISKILESYPDLNPDWLIMGRGEMLKTGKNLIKEVQEEVPVHEKIPDTDQGIIPFSEKRTSIVEKKKTKAVKSIEKIVLFYSDGTFRTYSPD